jgi:hypothetical protein
MFGFGFVNYGIFQNLDEAFQKILFSVKYKMQRITSIELKIKHFVANAVFGLSFIHH